MSERGILLVFGEPAGPESEDRFNEWYDAEHLGDVLDVPGFVAAARYRRLTAAAAGDAVPQRYLSVYEVESDDLEAVQSALSEAAASMHISTAMSREPRPVTVWYREVTPRRTA